ncbi:MAG: tetratricopeptide repeat protein [Planctomycetota bacterium]|jgi:Flp pilus assembly protein TadD|nr:tetratricopeptide repeat protein [Planctomycetota bacterium]
MRDAREKIVFVVALLVVAMLAYAKLSDRYVRTRAPTPGSIDAADLASPARVRLGGLENLPTGDRERGAFAPPRELLPMDRLNLPRPPRPGLSVRRPEVVPAPLAVAAGAARMSADSLGSLNLLAEEEGTAASAGGYGFSGTALSEVEETAGTSAGRALGATGDADGEEGVDPEKLYDWVERVSATRRHYGRLLNDDPHGLGLRTGEALLFQDVSLRTGSTVGVAYPIDRVDVAAFGLARTFENKYFAESRALSSGVGAVRPRMDLAIEMLEKADVESRALEFAEREARLAVAAGKKNPSAARLLARVCATRHDLEGELAVYREATQADHASAALFCDYGRFVLRQGLTERAAELLEEARRLRPVSAEVRTLAGLLLLEEGRAEEALASFRAADQVPYQSPFEEEQQTRLVLLSGRAELLSGDADAALRAAERILLNEPTDTEALRLAGAARVALGNLSEAAALYGEALAAQPTEGGLLTDAGIVAWISGDGPGAVLLLEQAIDRDPLRAARPMIALGFLYEDAADPERARELYVDALGLSPGHPDALYRLGRNQRLQGDAEEADATLRRALQLAGPDVLLLGELGCAALDRDESTLATRYFREALRVFEGDSEMLWMLGLAQLEEGDLVSAVQTLEQATLEGAEGAHAGLGVAKHRRGDAEAALVHFDEVERAFAGRANEPVALYAANQAAAVRDNLSKRQWVDRFGRSSLQRGWTEQQWDGSPRVFLDDEAVCIEGRMERSREDELPGIARAVDGRGFVSVQANLKSVPGGDSRFGLALTYRQVKGQRGRLPKARLEIWADEQGQVRLTVLDNFETLLLDGVPVEGVVISPGDSAELGIERVDAVAGTFRFLVDGRVVGDEIRVKSLRGFKNLLDLEIFGEAPPGRQVDVRVGEVRIVRLP